VKVDLVKEVPVKAELVKEALKIEEDVIKKRNFI
jgi:hypothetical protein